MATGVPESEMAAFVRFLDLRLGSDLENFSPEESVQEFREYQRELADLREKVQQAEESSARGESSALDIEATISKVRQRLAKDSQLSSPFS